MNSLQRGGWCILRSRRTRRPSIIVSYGAPITGEQPCGSAGLCARLRCGAVRVDGASQAFDDAKYPDLFGIWRAVNLRVGGQAAFDPTKPWGRGQQAPLTPEYQAILEASLADQANGGQGNWPSGIRCMPAGMPTAMTVYGEMEIVVLPDVTHILLNHNTGIHRRIFTDGRDWPKEAQPSYQGYSIGRWIDADGKGRFDRLEVETRSSRVPVPWIRRHADPCRQSVDRPESISFDKTTDILHDEITLIDLPSHDRGR